MGILYQEGPTKEKRRQFPLFCTECICVANCPCDYRIRTGICEDIAKKRKECIQNS